MDARQQRIQNLRAEIARKKGMAMQGDQEPQDTSQAHEGIADKLMNSPLGTPVNAVLGAGDAVQKFGMGLHGDNFKPSSEGGAYQAGNLAGNLGLWAGLSRLGGSALARVPAAGAMGQLAKMAGSSGKLPSFLRNVGAGSFMGAAENPEDRLQGAEEGGGIAAALGMAGPAVKALQKGAEYLHAPEYARAIYNKLGGGKSIQENAKDFAQQVKSKADYLKERYSNTMKPILERFKDRNDFPVDYWKAMKEEDPAWNGETISHEVKGFANKLMKNKDLNSAHELQKQVGDEMAYLKRKVDNATADTKEKNMYEKYKDWYYDSKKTITEYLEKHHPESAAKWNKSSDFWRDNIAPFHSETRLAQIAKGKEKNPIGFHEIFKAPESQMEYVAKALGERGKKRIAFSHLGTVPERIEVDRLKNGILEMKGNSGLESSMPKGLHEQAIELGKRDSAMNRALMFMPQLRRRWFRPPI